MPAQTRCGLWFTGLLGLMLFSSGCAYFPVKKHMPINQLGRFWGVGFSDGYHECDPRYLRERCGNGCGATCQSDCNNCGMYQVTSQVVPSSYQEAPGTVDHGMPYSSANQQPLWDAQPMHPGMTPPMNSNMQYWPGQGMSGQVPQSGLRPNEPKREEIPLPKKEPLKPSEDPANKSGQSDEELLPADPWSPSDRTPEANGEAERNAAEPNSDDLLPTDPKQGDTKPSEPKAAEPPIAGSSEDDLLVPLDARARRSKSLLLKGPTRSVNRYAPYSPYTYR